RVSPHKSIDSGELPAVATRRNAFFVHESVPDLYCGLQARDWRPRTQSFIAKSAGAGSRMRMSWAILSAGFRACGLATAKHRRKSGAPWELLSVYGFVATPANTEARRWLKYSPMRSGLATLRRTTASDSNSLAQPSPATKT